MILEALLVLSSFHSSQCLAQNSVPAQKTPKIKTAEPTEGQTHLERLGTQGDPTLPEEGGLKIEIFNKTSYDTNAKQFDVLGTHFGFEWDFTGKGFDRFRHEPDQDVYGLKIDLSGMPFLLHDSVENDLDRTIAQKVDRNLAHNPTYQGLPPNVQAAFRQQTIETIQDKQHSRLDYAADWETPIQQLAFSYGRGLGNGSVLFVDLGKICIHGGPATDSNGFTSGEFVRASNNPVQRALDSMGTGGCHINWGAYGGAPELHDTWLSAIQDIPASIGVDLWVFHERMPFISGRQFLGTLAQYSDSEFQNHKDFWKVDSALVRLSANMDVISAYLSAGYFNGEMGYGLGGSVTMERDENFNKTWSVSIDSTYSERARGMNGGFSAQVNRHLLEEKLTLFGLYSTGNNYYVPLNDREIDFNEAGLGASYACPIDVFGTRTHPTIQLAGECLFGELDDDSGKNVGGRLSLFFDWVF